MDAVERVEAAQQLREAFVIARGKMNDAIPDVVEARPAERALYSERYKADHEAERAYWSAALAVFEDGSITTLLSLARSNGWQDIEEWLRSVAGLAETPGIDYAAFAELVGKGARGILDRLRGSEDAALRTKVGDEH